jgi:hypothetical protein
LSGTTKKKYENLRIAGVCAKIQTEQNLGFQSAKSTFRKKSIDSERYYVYLEILNIEEFQYPFI